MKAFFDSIDAKVAAAFKSTLGKKKKVEPTLENPDDVGAPIFFLMGSLTNCSAKDAHAYARGLAESYITSPELARIRIFEDVATGRFIYELHEGGAGVSVIEPVLARLAAGEKARIRLTNGAQVVVEEAHDEVFSLVYPALDDVQAAAKLPGMEADAEDGVLLGLDEMGGTVEMKELYPQDKKLTHIGGVILGISLSIFMLTGGAYTINQTGILDGDALLRQTKAGILTDTVDNPVWQLDKAIRDAEQSGKTLSALKKGSTGWKVEMTN